MMPNLLFVIFLAVALAAYLYWGIRTLTGERWQILAAVPLRKQNGDWWDGVNLTWYGLLIGNANVVSVAVLFILMGSVGIPLAGTALMVVIMLSCCVPAARLVARVVEKKTHTFTVGGAVFVGVILAPAAVWLVNHTMGRAEAFSISPAAALAAMAIAYAFGEGLGRLACISFGCCYGKPLHDAPAWLRRLFSGRSFIFYGKTRKAVYADHLEGTQVLPVQALTAVIYSCCGLCSIYLYLHSRFATAFIATMAVTQGWRVLSEALRADYRGGGKVSAYQVMGIAAIIYGGAAILLSPPVLLSRPDIAAGIAAIWHPAPIIFLQAIWLIIFAYMGRSTVTGATISFHVHRDRI
jgi:Prolipoprotein diacylglyceryl transferase